MLKAIGIIFGLILLVTGVFPILAMFGIDIPNPLAYLGVFNLILISIGVILLLVLALKHEGMLKAISLIVGLLLLLLVVPSLLGLIGVSLFSLPGIIYSLQSYAYTIGGILLLIDAMTH